MTTEHDRERRRSRMIDFATIALYWYAVAAMLASVVLAIIGNRDAVLTLVALNVAAVATVAVAKAIHATYQSIR